MIFNACLGWHSTATYGSILSYIGYWIVIALTLVYLKFKEGRQAVFGHTSQAARDREVRKNTIVDDTNTAAVLDRKDSGSESDEVHEKNATAAAAASPSHVAQREEGQFITEEKIRA